MFDKFIGAVSRGYQKYGAAGFALGAVGFVVVEGFTAYNAGKRAGQNPDMTVKEKAINIAAPVAAGAAAIGCIAMSEHKNAGQIATLVSANVFNEKKRKKLMENVENFVGKENMEEFKKSLHPVKSEDIPKDLKAGEYIFVDDYTGAKTKDTLINMMEARNIWQKMYRANGFASYGSWLEFAGFQRFSKGSLPVSEDFDGNDLSNLGDEDIGFLSDMFYDAGYETDWIDINFVENKTDDGQIYYVVEFSCEPSAAYMNY